MVDDGVATLAFVPQSVRAIFSLFWLCAVYVYFNVCSDHVKVLVLQTMVSHI